MRNFTLIFLLFSTIIYGQNPIEWEDVIQVKNTSKEELFNRARSWFADTYNDESEVITISDKESGEISGNATMKYTARSFVSNMCISGYINYKINIYVKEGRYKYKFHSLVHEGSPCAALPINYGLLTDSKNHKRSKKEWANMKEKSKEYIEMLIASLKVAMEKPSENNDNW